LLSLEGTVLKSDIEGSIIVRCELSGMPQCEIGINESLMVQESERIRFDSKNSELGTSSAFENMSFHQCVRLQNFAKNRTISFVPPDGEFVLLQYRTAKIQSPFQIFTRIKQINNIQIGLTVQVLAQFANSILCTDIVIFIPTPPGTLKCRIGLVGKNGKAKFDSTKGGIIWKAKKWPGKEERELVVIIALVPNSKVSQRDQPPITLQFSMPVAISGLQVTHLKVTEKSGYEISRWIKYITEVGYFHKRITYPIWFFKQQAVTNQIMCRFMIIIIKS